MIVTAILAVAPDEVKDSVHVAQDRLASGLQVGEHIKHFPALIVNGPVSNRNDNILGYFGRRPTALVFVRTHGADIQKLIKRLDAKKIDTSKEESTSNRLAVGIIFLSERDKEKHTAETVRQLADNEKLKKAWLAIYNSLDGPKGYGLAKEAAVTVVLYKNKTIVETLAYRDREFDEKAIMAILEGTSRLLTSKK